MERRTALKVLVGSAVSINLPVVAAQHVHLVQIATNPGAYKLLFFSGQENQLLNQLSEMIIPADDRSPGAHDAKVSQYIDLFVAHSEVAVQDEWRLALQAVDAEAQRRFGKTFAECNESSRDALMAQWARNESDPKTQLEEFFVELKRMTAAGHYSSEIGLLKDLGYKGNTALSEFPGCTHGDHV